MSGYHATTSGGKRVTWKPRGPAMIILSPVLERSIGVSKSNASRRSCSGPLPGGVVALRPVSPVLLMCRADERDDAEVTDDLMRTPLLTRKPTTCLASNASDVMVDAAE